MVAPQHWSFSFRPELTHRHAPHMLLTCSSHAPHMFLTCSSHVPHMLLTCSSHAIHMLLTCSPHGPHMFLTCSSHVPHMILNLCGVCVNMFFYMWTCFFDQQLDSEGKRYLTEPVSSGSWRFKRSETWRRKVWFVCFFLWFPVNSWKEVLIKADLNLHVHLIMYELLEKTL